MSVRLCGELYAVAGRRGMVGSRPVGGRAAFHVNNPTSCFIAPRSGRRVRTVIRLYGGRRVPCSIVKGKDGLLIKSGKCHNMVLRVFGGVGRVEMRRGGVCTNTNTLLSGVTTATLSRSLANFRFTTKVPKALNKTIHVGTNTCNKRVGRILRDIGIVATSNKFLAVPMRRVKLTCQADIMRRGGCVILRTIVSLRGKGPRGVGRIVSSLGRGEIAGRPLRCTDTKDAFGHPRKCFTKGLVKSTKLHKFEIKSTRISRGRYNFIVGEKGTDTTRVVRLVHRMRSGMRRGSKIHLRTRMEEVKRF